MDVWIVTIGWYEDRRIVGVAVTEADANEMVNRILANDAFKNEDLASLDIHEAFRIGQIYDWKGEQV